MSLPLTNDLHFADLLSMRAIETPNAIACTFLAKNNTATDLTYQQLDSRARSLAAYLQQLGLKENARVILLYQPGIEFLVALFGCFYAGAIAVPLHPPIGLQLRHKLIQVVKSADPHFILLDKKTLQLLEMQSELQPLISLCKVCDELDQQLASAWQAPTLSPMQLAILQYTSGTTGDPKGVMLSHQNIMANEHLIAKVFGHKAHDVGVNWLPPYHDMGLIGTILQGFYVGKRSVLLSPMQFLENPACWLQAITDYQATISGGPNFAYQYCVQQIEDISNFKLHTWEVAFNGAEAIHPKTMEDFFRKFACVGFNKKSFLPCYGLAEATLLVAGRQRGQGAQTLLVDKTALQKNQVTVSVASENTQTLVSCGAPVQLLQIVDPKTHALCEPHQIGEIWVSDASVAQGYWQEGQKTNEAFQAKLKNNQSQQYLRTGDLGFMHAGELYVTGRMKELIIIRGINYYPQDIESTICEIYPELAGKVLSFATTVDEHERLVIVMRTPKSHPKDTYPVLMQNIADHVFKVHHIMPASIAIVRSHGIMKTSSGKLQRLATQVAFQNKTLPILEMKHFKNKKFNPAKITKKIVTCAQMEQLLKRYVAHYLRKPIKDISSLTPLVHYGLDSLAAVKLTSLLSEQLNREISALLIYEYPNINLLAEYLINGQEKTHTDSEQPLFEPIAIIGMGCYFPGNANTPEAFWNMLLSGKSAITKREGQTGGFLKNIDLFAADFFGIPAPEADLMDPQHRLLLEVTWQALAHAGIDPSCLNNTSTGVYVGMSQQDYQHLLFEHAGTDLTSVYAATGNAMSAASGRISYLLGAQGPSMTIDTACSSALVAIDTACQHLHNRQTDLAIAGAVNLILHPHTTQLLSRAHILAPDAHCKVFDEKADGYVRAEGCGVVILKRLCKAEQDKDTVLAIIRASTVNQDGRSQGLMAPNPQAQIKLTKRSLHISGLTADKINYIEAHGTGTALGDPLEIAALDNALERNKHLPAVMIGSVKSQIGHLEAAAGMAGLFKTVLALQAGKIPAQMHLKKLNPLLKLNDIPAVIPTQITVLPQNNTPHFAMINAFGFTGTNAQMILEAAPVTVNQKKSLPGYRFARKRYWFVREHLTDLLVPWQQQLQLHLKAYPALHRADENALISFCWHYIEAALERSKKVVPEQQTLFQYLVTAKDVYVEAGGEIPRAVDANLLCERYPDYAAEILLAAQCGEHLVQVLQGDLNPLTLLFSKQYASSAENVYKYALQSQVMNGLLAWAVQKIISTKRDKPIRILEIGAGTGSATQGILPLLPQNAAYVFTDVSEIFIHLARKNFATCPQVEYQLLDIELSPLTQGFYPGQFDLIIASQVLHATKDIAQTLNHIHGLLNKNGVLLFAENTQPSIWLDMTFGLLEGWWRFADKKLRPNYPLLSVKKWKRTVEKCGYKDWVAITYPGQGKPTLMAVQACIQNQRFSPHHSPIIFHPQECENNELPGDVKLGADDSLDFYKNNIKNYLAAMLHMASIDIQEHIPFVHMGIDSLMSVELLNHLQKSLPHNIQLPMWELATKTTVAQLAEYLADQAHVQSEKTAMKRDVNDVIIPDFNL